MTDDDAPPTSTTTKEIISKWFDIKQEDINYKLNLEAINENISFYLFDDKELLNEYELKLTIVDLKQMNKAFSIFNSCGELINYISNLINNKKMKIKQLTENTTTIELPIEHLYQQNIITIGLTKKYFKLIDRDLYKNIYVLNENYKKLKEENKKLRQQHKKMKNCFILFISILILFFAFTYKISKKEKENLVHEYLSLNINSSILKENEFDMVKKEIEKRMNKKIKGINKLYQATKDGGDAYIFHRKCDNIPNTLVLYESAGRRRFGGFTSQSWSSILEYKTDKNCFLFSLDNKKIYNQQFGNYQLFCDSKYGPSFNFLKNLCIRLKGNALINNSLKTYGDNMKRYFDGKSNELSEYADNNAYPLYEDKLNYKIKSKKGIYAKEYEVFEIKF